MVLGTYTKSDWYYDIQKRLTNDSHLTATLSTARQCICTYRQESRYQAEVSCAAIRTSVV
ncbi:hypothetical protein ALT785_130034 [Alteromonas infernus]